MLSMTEYQNQLAVLREKRRRAIARRAPDYVVSTWTQRIARLQIEQYKANKANGRA
jgi:hypothetical protein